MYRNTAGDGWTALQVAVAAIAALVSLVAASYSVSQVEFHRIQRLESHAAQMGIDISELRRRVTQLERPDEPVYLPRQPGRLGPILPIRPWTGSEIGSSSDQPIGLSIDQR